MKTLQQIPGVSAENAVQIRDIMRGYAAIPCACGRMSDPGSCDAYPANVCRYYHDGRHRYSRMAAIDRVLGTCGVEYIPAGHNQRSPAITYCNAGDTYATTVMWVRGRYLVGCWGSIVERGRYD